MQRVLDALIDDKPAPPDAQAALSPAERAEAAALARTTQLTRVTLQNSRPAPDAEARALDEAQSALRAQSVVGAANAAKRRTLWEQMALLLRVGGRGQE